MAVGIVEVKMPKDLPPLESWQFYHACRKILGDTYLVTLHRKSPRQIYRWSANPAFTSDRRNNPIDLLEILLDRLCELGKEEIAIAAVRIFAKRVGCEIQVQNGYLPDKKNIEEECLDDYPALVELHKAIREGKSIKEVEYLAEEAKLEIDETRQRYITDRYKGGG